MICFQGQFVRIEWPMFVREKLRMWHRRKSMWMSFVHTFSGTTVNLARSPVDPCPSVTSSYESVFVVSADTNTQVTLTLSNGRLQIYLSTQVLQPSPRRGGCLPHDKQIDTQGLLWFIVVAVYTIAVHINLLLTHFWKATTMFNYSSVPGQGFMSRRTDKVPI